jgi:hypothetical protein
LGIEGNSARIYFGGFAGMIKADEETGSEPEFNFDFAGRNRRPPRDAVNALLSLAYSVLAKDLTLACYAVGFDPLQGLSSASVWPAGARAGPDGTVSSADRGFGGVERDQYAHGDSWRFCAGWTGGFDVAWRASRILSSV